MAEILRTTRMDDINFEIRGPLLQEAERLQAAGEEIVNLSIGNPPAFGICAPGHIVREVAERIEEAEPYGPAKGMVRAREAILEQCRRKGIEGVDIEDIYVGNGASEVIVMALQGLLNFGDEVLIPCPDFPLWTAAVKLIGGTPVCYMCDEAAGWGPDLKDIASKITPKTRGIVVINPNNPTGAVYPRETLLKIVELAAAHDLVIFADEIYDHVVYDGATHVPMASLSRDVLFVTFNGLAKTHQLPGFRAGWMVVSGNKAAARDYMLNGLDVLANMRLCGGMVAQLAIPPALASYDDLHALTSPGGRLYEQRIAAYESFNAVPGVSCVKPMGALYLFPKIDAVRYGIHDDQKFLLEFLKAKKVLLVQGTGFAWPGPDHFRVVFLPEAAVIRSVADRLTAFLATYRQA
jgi:alanine-synthesizing transaminase